MSNFFKNLPETKSFSRENLTQQLQFLGQMVNTEIAFFHQLTASKNGLSITESKTISILMQEGSMTAGELAKRLSLTTGAVTNVLDRMNKGGFLKRVFDPKDRRKVMVEINPKKLKQLGKPYESVSVAFHKLVENYTVKELKFLVQFYKSSIEITRSEIEKLSKT
jgi:MarR family transcriptional regulator, organic hydroperoxide resistance regulator